MRTGWKQRVNLQSLAARLFLLTWVVRLTPVVRDVATVLLLWENERRLELEKEAAVWKGKAEMHLRSYRTLLRQASRLTHSSFTAAAVCPPLMCFTYSRSFRISFWRETVSETRADVSQGRAFGRMKCVALVVETVDSWGGWDRLGSCRDFSKGRR